jgi:hypothetical protein
MLQRSLLNTQSLILYIRFTCWSLSAYTCLRIVSATSSTRLPRCPATGIPRVRLASNLDTSHQRAHFQAIVGENTHHIRAYPGGLCWRDGFETDHCKTDQNLTSPTGFCTHEACWNGTISCGLLLQLRMPHTSPSPTSAPSKRTVYWLVICIIFLSYTFSSEGIERPLSGSKVTVRRCLTSNAVSCAPVLCHQCEVEI